jgi:hypothetical protein
MMAAKQPRAKSRSEGTMVDQPYDEQESPKHAEEIIVQPTSIKDGVGGTSIRVGTLVYGAFAAITLLAAMNKGFPPIYLLEAGGLAWAAWYWQAKKAHSEVAKRLVIIFAVVVVVGEIAQTAYQGNRFQAIPGNSSLRFDSKTVQNCWLGGPGERDYDKYGNLRSTTTVPHLPTCASLKGFGDPVMADSLPLINNWAQQ